MIDMMQAPGVWIQIMLTALPRTNMRRCTILATVPFEAHFERDGEQVVMVAMPDGRSFVASDVVPSGVVPHIREVVE